MIPFVNQENGRVPDGAPEEDDAVPGRQGDDDGRRAQEDDRGHHQEGRQGAEALQQGGSRKSSLENCITSNNLRKVKIFKYNFTDW